MKFKKNHYDLIQDISNAAYVSIDNYNFGGNVKSAVENAIQQSVTSAFQRLIDNIYTDEEFERDLGLRD